jgi:hypothetical protein
MRKLPIPARIFEAVRIAAREAFMYFRSLFFMLSPLSGDSGSASSNTQFADFPGSFCDNVI